MRTNATIVRIDRTTGQVETRAIRCVFSGSSLTDQGGTTAKLKGTLLIPHHELVRDAPTPPHSYPKVGDTVAVRLDTHAPNDFGDDVEYVIETAKGVPGGPLKHWHYTLR